MKHKPFTWIVLLALALVVSFAVMTPVAQAKPSASDCIKYHTIKEGDSLAYISDKYDVKVADIVKINGLHSPYTIYVAKSLCIPKNSKPESSHPAYASALAASFNPAIKGDKLTVKATYFPKASTYYVKAAPPGTPSAKYAKIGLFKTLKGGTVQADYILPKELRKYKTLSICLKNVSTDAIICRNANLP